VTADVGFQSLKPIQNIKRTCKNSKKRLSTALDKARQAKKRRKVDELAAEEPLASPSGLNAMPDIPIVTDSAPTPPVQNAAVCLFPFVFVFLMLCKITLIRARPAQ